MASKTDHHDCLFYAIETVFQLYHGDDMMYELSRKKPDPTLLLTQGIFNLPHQLAIDDAVSYTKRRNRLQHSVVPVTGFVPLSPRSPTLCFNQLNHLPTAHETISQGLTGSPGRRVYVTTSSPATARLFTYFHYLCELFVQHELFAYIDDSFGGSSPPSPSHDQ